MHRNSRDDEGCVRTSDLPPPPPLLPLRLFEEMGKLDIKEQDGLEEQFLSVGAVITQR